ncbi:MAG: response regulator [Planctomycetes bacterium]|nr:response regulator [Planctomycetota bacterium]
MKLLVVDDTEEYIPLMQMMLKSYGQADSAMDGQTAIDKVESALKSNDPYKIVFLDILMPIMTGREVVRKIREIEEGLGIDHDERTRILLVSAQSDTETVLGSMLDDGGDGYLIKPIDKDKLKSAIEDLELEG